LRGEEVVGMEYVKLARRQWQWAEMVMVREDMVGSVNWIMEDLK
jgi:hypothetical protein